MKYLKLIPLFLLCILCSCKISKQKNNTPSVQKESDISPKLIFVNFKITKDSTQSNSSIDLTKIQITDGSIKKPELPEINKPSYQNRLRCVFEDNNGKNIYETVIEHPLFRKFEYTKDDGSFGVKDVVLKEAVFSIRTDYSNDMKFFRIFEKLTSANEKEIAKLELK